MTIEWLENDYRMTIELTLADYREWLLYRMTIEWLKNDYRMTIQLTFTDYTENDFYAEWLAYIMTIQLTFTDYIENEYYAEWLAYRMTTELTSADYIENDFYAEWFTYIRTVELTLRIATSRTAHRISHSSNFDFWEFWQESSCQNSQKSARHVIYYIEGL